MIFQSSKLVEVTSNIWGTKFQIIGCASFLSEFLGHVVYKTSLLHLQPRQMTITLSEISGSAQQLSRDPNFTPAGFSEDEDDLSKCLVIQKLTAMIVKKSFFFHNGLCKTIPLRSTCCCKTLSLI